VADRCGLCLRAVLSHFHMVCRLQLLDTGSLGGGVDCLV
jgi:hypothetical protein